MQFPDHTSPHGSMNKKPRIEIEYCTQCRWLLRAAWNAQELLTTFEQELGEVALIPGKSGIFDIRAAGRRIWSRREEGRSPEIKEIKQRLRERFAPDKALGHSDAPPASRSNQDEYPTNA
jgi:selenoprotein W-related protein